MIVTTHWFKFLLPVLTELCLDSLYDEYLVMCAPVEIQIHQPLLPGRYVADLSTSVMFETLYGLTISAVLMVVFVLISANYLDIYQMYDVVC